MSVFFVHDPTQRIVTPLDRRYYVRGIPTAQAISAALPVHDDSLPSQANLPNQTQSDPELAAQRRQVSDAYRQHEMTSGDNLAPPLKVRDLMSNEVVTIDEKRSVGYLWKIMQSKHISHLAVTGDDGFLVGFVSEHHLADYLMTHSPLDPNTELVSSLCQSRLVSTSADTAVSSLVNYLVEHGVDGLPATENGSLVGVITMKDILKQTLSNTPDTLA